MASISGPFAAEPLEKSERTTLERAMSAPPARTCLATAWRPFWQWRCLAAVTALGRRRFPRLGGRDRERLTGHPYGLFPVVCRAAMCYKEGWLRGRT
jgi:hypothetical protein